METQTLRVRNVTSEVKLPQGVAASHGGNKCTTGDEWERSMLFPLYVVQDNDLEGLNHHLLVLVQFLLSSSKNCSVYRLNIPFHSFTSVLTKNRSLKKKRIKTASSREDSWKDAREKKNAGKSEQLEGGEKNTNWTDDHRRVWMHLYTKVWTFLQFNLYIVTVALAKNYAQYLKNDKKT